MSLPDDPVETIHSLIEANRYRIGWHAVQHMFEEGFDTSDLLHGLSRNLQVLEQYEDDKRVLVLGYFPVGQVTVCALHAVCDFSNADSLDIVTAYIPAQPYWVNPRQRGVRR